MPESNRELADFLRRARSSIDPSHVPLPADGRVRRVPGLRREEVAYLAGVSTDYYVRLEQGRAITPSDSVLDALARALALDTTGRAHLGDLVGATPAVSPSPSSSARVRPGLYQLLDALEHQPAFILGRRSDILAANRMAKALLADFDRLPARDRNYARWVLLSDEARALFLDWEEQARAAVESLRLEVGRHPDDQATRDLIADLGTRSPEFRRWWEEHRVYQRTFGFKRLRHPVAGELTIDYETLTLPGDPDRTLFIYTTKEGSPSRRSIDLLAEMIQVRDQRR
ncbi:MmyB family transcriptional regulator [Actinoplanes friuliensis]|uniref:XRE family transcriptional regulator n=1 Tax=Actinoplanes friuliensis DSM 7358 TaxID=1246995 RepID=U5W4E2_9ACTN|nr:helix-turn-helix domain-containing protein [Actinoplanes friuliensis]AGZ42860.1 XRE family transcriptional regulator [Actinoplanes friuliensis DSM 7358]